MPKIARLNGDRDWIDFDCVERERTFEPAEDELQDALKEMVGEDVYNSDYREAAMVIGQRNPELIAGVLRKWGYDPERV